MAQSTRLDVSVFQVNNNVRKNVLTVSAVVASANGDTTQRNLSLLPLASVTHIQTAGNKATILSCSKPVQVSVTPQSGVAWTQTVTALLVLDFEVNQLVITNNSAVDTSAVTMLNG